MATAVDIDLERAVHDPDYRRRVIEQLKAEAQGARPEKTAASPRAEPQAEAGERRAG